MKFVDNLNRTHFYFIRNKVIYSIIDYNAGGIGKEIPSIGTEEYYTPKIKVQKGSEEPYDVYLSELIDDGDLWETRHLPTKILHDGAATEINFVDYYFELAKEEIQKYINSKRPSLDRFRNDVHKIIPEYMISGNGYSISGTITPTSTAFTNINEMQIDVDKVFNDSVIELAVESAIYCANKSLSVDNKMLKKSGEDKIRQFIEDENNREPGIEPSISYGKAYMPTLSTNVMKRFYFVRGDVIYRISTSQDNDECGIWAISDEDFMPQITVVMDNECSPNTTYYLDTLISDGDKMEGLKPYKVIAPNISMTYTEYLFALADNALRNIIGKEDLSYDEFVLKAKKIIPNWMIKGVAESVTTNETVQGGIESLLIDLDDKYNTLLIGGSGNDATSCANSQLSLIEEHLKSPITISESDVMKMSLIGITYNVPTKNVDYLILNNNANTNVWKYSLNRVAHTPSETGSTYFKFPQSGSNCVNFCLTENEVKDVCFKGNTGVTKVTVPFDSNGGDWDFVNKYTDSFENPLRKFGANSFSGCTALTEVDITPSVNKKNNTLVGVDTAAFAGCVNLEIFDFEQIQWINERAFEDCSKLTDLNLHNISSLKEGAFYNCSGVNNIYVGDKLTTVGSGVFHGCSGVTSFTCYSDMSSFAENSFSAMTRLNTVFIGGSGSINQNAFKGNTSIQKVTVGNQNIGKSAFSGCTEIDYLRITGRINVNESAFEGCTSLVKPDISGVTGGIGRNAFKGCNGIVSATTQASTIGEGAFSNCSSLTSMVITNISNEIGNAAFSNCNNLSSVTISVPQNKYISIGNAAFSGDTNAVFTSGSLSSVSSISSNAFANNNTITTLNLPHIKKIDSNAFANCTNISSITLNASSYYNSRQISTSAFNGCNNVKRFSTNLKISGDSGFNIGVLAPMTGLSAFTVSGKDNDPGIISGNTLQGRTSLKSVSISSHSISNGVFSGCTGISSLTLAGKVSTIGNNAFDGCIGIKSVVIPNGTTTIGNYAFNGCDSLSSVTFNGMVSNGIGESVFVGTKLRGVNIKAKSIGVSAFKDIATLTSLSLADGLVTINNAAFQGCEGITDVTIPNSVTSIGDNAFNGCSHLVNIRMVSDEPDSVTVGSGTFDTSVEGMRILVPYEAVDAYKQAEGWSVYADYIEGYGS